MKKLITLVVAFFLVKAHMNAANYTVGNGGNYPNLQSAFAAINAGTITGNIILQIISSTTEPSAVLLDGGVSTSTYNSITIYPTSSGLIINGNIQLNACDNVHFDGRANQSGNAKDLTIQGTNLSAIRFMDAQYCSVKYCNLQGGQSVVDLNASMDWLTNTGSSFNNISYNNISYTTKNPSHDALLRSGTSNGLENFGDTISNNHFFNFITTTGATTKSRAIAIRNYSRGLYIADNSIYDDANIVNPFNANTWAIFVDINSTLPNNATASTINAYKAFPHQIIGNYLGSTQALCAGSNISLVNQGIDVVVRGIKTELSTQLPITIQNNTLSGFSLNAGNGLNADFPFVGIAVDGGIPTIKGNTIGSNSATSNLLFTSPSSSDNFGIWIGAVDSVWVGNNTIGGVALNSQYNPQKFTAIKKTNNGKAVIIGNFIGSSTNPNSIYDFGSSPLETSIIGINVQDFSTTTSNTNCIVSNNTIQNLKQNTGSNTLGVAGIVIEGNMQMNNAIIENNIIRNLSTNGLGYESAVGIKISGSNPTMNVQVNNNTIYKIVNMTATPNAQDVIGIEILNSVTAQINNNYISSIRANSNNTGFSEGIFVTGKSQMANNIVYMDTTFNKCYAIRTGAGDCKLIHNTLVIQGQLSNTLSIVLAGKSSDTIYNNIFANYNTNSSGTQTNHRCLNFGLKNASSDYNHFFIQSPGLGGAYVVDEMTSFSIVNGQLVVTTTYTPIVTYPTFQTWSGNNVHSIGGLDPLFANTTNGLASGFYPGNPFPTNNNLITLDYFNVNRTNAWAGAIESFTTPLPLTWQSFTAIDKKEFIALEWEIKNEVNLSHFEIERSADANHFIQLQTVMANATEIEDPKTMYHYNDENPLPTHEFYYRIKQVDIDGHYTYSSTQKITRKPSIDIEIYPNPATTALHIHLTSQEPTQIEIFSPMGQRITKTTLTSSDKIDVSWLKSGQYLLQCTNKEKTFTTSFIKQ